MRFLPATRTHTRAKTPAANEIVYVFVSQPHLLKQTTQSLLLVRSDEVMERPRKSLIHYALTKLYVCVGVYEYICAYVMHTHTKIKAALSKIFNFQLLHNIFLGSGDLFP